MRIPYFHNIGLQWTIAGAAIGLALMTNPAGAQETQNTQGGVGGCGPYGLFLNVTDEVGNPIHAVYPRLATTGEHVPQDTQIITSKQFERTTKDYRGFQFLLGGNEQPRGIYTLYVTAAGYLPYEREITFPYCRNQRINIRLKLQSGKKPVRRQEPVRKKPATKVPVKKPTIR